MSSGIIILLFVIIFIINILVTLVLIARNNATHKILGKLQQEALSIKNDIDNHILLADDAMNQMKLLLKEVETYTANSKFSTVKKAKQNKEQKSTSQKNHRDSIDNPEANQDNRTLIKTMLSNGIEEQEIVQLLNVSFHEVEIVKLKYFSNR